MSDYIINLVRRGAGLAPAPAAVDQPPTAPDWTAARFAADNEAAASEATDATPENATSALPAPALPNAPARPPSDSLAPVSADGGASATAQVSAPPSVQRAALATPAVQPATAVSVVPAPAPTPPTNGGSFETGGSEHVPAELASGDISPQPELRPPAASQPPAGGETIEARPILAEPAEVNDLREATVRYESATVGELVRVMEPEPAQPAPSPDHSTSTHQTPELTGLETPSPEQPPARVAATEWDEPPIQFEKPSLAEPGRTPKTTPRVAPHDTHDSPPTPVELAEDSRTGFDASQNKIAPLAKGQRLEPSRPNIPAPSSLAPSTRAPSKLAPSMLAPAATVAITQPAPPTAEPAATYDAPARAAVRPAVPEVAGLPAADRDTSRQPVEAESGASQAEVVSHAVAPVIVQPGQPTGQPPLRLSPPVDRPRQPSVQVRIGSLEIRATTPETQSPTPPPPRPAPRSLGFDDYRSIRGHIHRNEF